MDGVGAMTQRGDARIRELKEAFPRAFGADPDGVWEAPGRVNLVGEHTDYNDGFVLPFALSETVQAAVRAREDRTVRILSGQQEDSAKVDLDALARSDALQPGRRVSGWAAYPVGVLWALEQAGHRLRGMDVLLGSSVPTGAGLSSSAALECAVGLAAAESAGIELDPLALARMAQRAENDYVGMPCGIMDQTASTTGRQGHALLLDTRSMQLEHVPLELERAGLSLLVIDAQAPHRLVDGEYADRRRQCEEGARTLGIESLRVLTDQGTTPEELDVSVEDDVVRRRVRHVLTENARVLEAAQLLRDGDPAELGEILNAAHVSQQEDFEITVPETDRLVETVLQAGAWGARQVGGGFGGCVIALVPQDAHEAVVAAAASQAERRGLEAPLMLTAEPAPGARRTA
ncbi:galactokinase [Nesterenkonia sp. NBAIMH1]|uniref:galactokinase n=1 Tax=Nesterenkonia sp. NBAIMH1 TaxID=2600320 RepID=UPI001FEDBEE3|nr:galactokinase [Nesterenkonia sp. NBAIMH1]